MRAVNLIPGDQHAGPRIKVGRSGGGAYAVLGLLAGLVLLVFLYGQASHQISSRRAQIASLEARVAQAQAQASELTPYANFVSLREQRVDAVTQLVDSRFDWPGAFYELGRVLPASASIQQLDGTVGGSAGSGSSSSTASLAEQSRALPPAARDRDPGRLGRQLRHATRQCAQLRALRLRDQPGRGRPHARTPAPDRRRQRSPPAELLQLEPPARAAAAAAPTVGRTMSRSARRSCSTRFRACPLTAPPESTATFASASGAGSTSSASASASASTASTASGAVR